MQKMDYLAYRTEVGKLMSLFYIFESLDFRSMYRNIFPPKLLLVMRLQNLHIYSRCSFTLKIFGESPVTFLNIRLK
jgi:hypothetical protein